MSLVSALTYQTKSQRLKAIEQAYGQREAAKAVAPAPSPVPRASRAPVKLKMPFLDYARQVYPRYVADPMHELVASYLEKLVTREILRLMIFAPPQHGKSLQCSNLFPGYWLMHYPYDPVMMACYGARLARRHSRVARRIVQSPEYQALAPEVRISKESRSVDTWELDNGAGGLIAAGVGGPLVGLGAGLAIGDDLYKSWAEAASPTIQENVEEWWEGTFWTRLWEDAPAVLTMTRWNRKDLPATLLAKQPNVWTVLRLSALGETQEERDQRNKECALPAGLPDPLGREPGEALAPHRFSVAALAEKRRSVGSRVWEAEYMGSPIDPSGALFKRHWFEIVPEAPKNVLGRVRRWDNAATEGDGDFTAGCRMSRTADGSYYIEHMVHGQYSSFQRRKIQRQTAESDGDETFILIVQDPGSAGVDTVQHDLVNLEGFAVSVIRETGSKVVRAQPFAAACEGGRVKLVRGPWVEAFLDEICAFPDGANDDQVDTPVGGYSYLAKRFGGDTRKQGENEDNG